MCIKSLFSRRVEPERKKFVKIRFVILLQIGNLEMVILLFKVFLVSFFNKHTVLSILMTV